MRDLTILLILFTLFLLLVGYIFIFRIHFTLNKNDIKGCIYNLKNINKYLNIMKIAYIVYIVVFIDTCFIYNEQLLDAFNQNKTLICKINNNKTISISNNQFYIIKQYTFFLPSIKAYKKTDNNISIDLTNCKIKDKRWYQ